MYLIITPQNVSYSQAYKGWFGTASATWENIFCVTLFLDVKKHRSKYRSNHCCRNAFVFFFRNGFRLHPLDVRPCLFNLGALLFRCEIHVICKPLQGLHPISQFDSSSVFSLLHLCQDCSIHIQRVFKFRSVDYSCQCFFFSGLFIFHLDRPVHCHHGDFFCTKFHVICDIRKSYIYVFLEDISFRYQLSVQSVLFQSLDFFFYPSIS